MSYRITAAAVKGDRLNEIGDILRAGGLEGYQGPEQVDSWDLIAQEIVAAKPSDRAPVAACIVRGWTLLLNQRLALAVYDYAEPWVSLMQPRNMTFFAVIADSATGMYGYRLQGPSQARSVFVDGERLEERGEPLECEGSLVPEDYSEDDLLDIMEFLEIDFESGLECASPVMVYRPSS